MIYLSEIAAYLWHRIAAHTNILYPVKKTHDIHHNVIDDEAHLDFIYVCVLLLFYLIFLSFLYYKEYITFTWLLVLYTPVFLTLVWNWYVHSAYHQTDTFLEQYEWFQNDRRIHMQHHKNPEVNFGIATHFTDEILETFNYGYPCCDIE